MPTSGQPFGSGSVKSGLDTAGGALSQALGGNGDRLTYDNVSDLPPTEAAIRHRRRGHRFVPCRWRLRRSPMARAGVAGPKVLAPVMEMARNSPGLFAAGEVPPALPVPRRAALA